MLLESGRPRCNKGKYVIPRWGSLLEKGGFIEPVHEKGGYRVPSLTGR